MSNHRNFHRQNKQEEETYPSAGDVRVLLSRLRGDDETPTGLFSRAPNHKRGGSQDGEAPQNDSDCPFLSGSSPNVN